ncbi:hypothetical protein HD598_002391 [Neomicrococcus aestuarii]|uniref:THIF-type NAD/FAD binding fold domain-containing protein n=1 Tax=Neomicrococcus aestuarii TaxID=556325 RepID=A0A7W8TVR5_9MICC|nr:ThiF family adenylyltransferase [Neomicrococcus aestuarii]MBB5513704.1 hypothetical protein [Neomicrococcus aestuarii]
MRINPGLRIVDLQDGYLRIGTDDFSVSFSGLTPREREFIHSLSHPGQGAGYDGRDIPEARRAWILGRLKEVSVPSPRYRISGTLNDVLSPEITRASATYRTHAGPLIQRRHESHVHLFGLDRCSVQLAITLANAGVGHLHLYDLADVDLTDLGGALLTIADLGLPRAIQVAKQLKRLHHRLDVTVHRQISISPADGSLVNGRSSTDSRPVVSVAMGRDSLQPAVREALTTSAHAYTQVIFSDSAATLGPMVLSGIPGCFDCLDHKIPPLTDADHDASTQFPLPPGVLIPDAASASVMAGLAAQQILMVLDGQLLPATVGALMTFQLETGATVTRSIPDNILCACHSSAA